MLPSSPRQVMKFICKDFWAELFHKNVDNLRTNKRWAVGRGRAGWAYIMLPGGKSLVWGLARGAWRMGRLSAPNREGKSGASICGHARQV